MKTVRSVPVLAVLFSSAVICRAAVGAFEGQGDVGAVLHAGSAEYDPAKQTYTVKGSGENMWFAAAALHFVWKKVEGDAALTADIAFPQPGGNEHRKAVLMIRQSLDPDSAYADVALHGVRLTSLQFRDARGDNTDEVQASVSAPNWLRIEKRGEYCYMWLGGDGQELEFAGGSPKIPIHGPFYIGIGVCSHDKDVVETAVFSNVDIGVPTSSDSTLYSTLETVTVASTDRRVSYTTKGRVEAPNWMHNGESLLFNSGGGIERVAVSGGAPQKIDTGSVTHCTAAHGISPDGSQLAFTSESGIYTVPVAGGSPKLVTKRFPSEWHGWSPDGQTLVFSAGGDIYAIPASGGEETRLTKDAGMNGGPEYSPDGEYIYFHSDRSGSTHLAHAARRRRAGAGDLGRVQQCASASLAGWQADGDAVVCEGR